MKCFSRQYWDFSPKTSVMSGDKELYFEWSRPTFGWSIGFDFETAIISRFDIVPKAGWMNLDANVGIESSAGDGSIVTENFVIEKELAIGLEIGIEKQTNWFLLRLWGAADGAGFFNQLAGEGAVSSLRGGIDSYFDLFDIGKTFEASLLLFTSGEQIALSRKPQEDPELAAQTGINVDGISYTLGFVGMGVTLTW